MYKLGVLSLNPFTNGNIRGKRFSGSDGIDPTEKAEADDDYNVAFLGFLCWKLRFPVIWIQEINKGRAGQHKNGHTAHNGLWNRQVKLDSVVHTPHI
jgi:hypothetical protein